MCPVFVPIAEAEHIVGMDEVGAGSWAGPITLAAVLAPVKWLVPNLKDSKRFSSRAFLSSVARSVLASPEAHTVIRSASPKEIDSRGFYPSIHHVAKEAIVECLSLIASSEKVAVVIDGVMKIDAPFPYHCIPQAEDKFKHVAAASIVAKHTRDAYMVEMSEQYPEYGFASSVGYGTAEHRAALTRYGACPIHRLSVTPVRDAMFFRGELTREEHTASSYKGRMREKL